MSRRSTRLDSLGRALAVVAIVAAVLSKLFVVGAPPTLSAELAKDLHGPAATLAVTNCDNKGEGAPAPNCPHQHDHCVLCALAGSHGEDHLAISSWTRLLFSLFDFASTTVFIDHRDIRTFALLRCRSLPARAPPAFPA